MGQVSFDDYFKDRALRVDFELVSADGIEVIVLKGLKQEPYWGGNPKSMHGQSHMGDFVLSILDEDDQLLYEKGFNSLGREWATTSDAKTMFASFYHAIQVPFPKVEVKLVISARQSNGEVKPIFHREVDPNDCMISRDQVMDYPVDTLVYSGSSADCLDLVFLAEGYTKEQMGKFESDVRRFYDWIFAVSPYSEFADYVNVYAVSSPSIHSGPDVPGEHIYNSTMFDSSFYTFGSPRYLTVRDTKKMYDVAALVPYDHVYVLVNTDIYGGAGFYNTYTSCASDCLYAREIASHELAHGLVGLADEYFDNDSDEISYFYNLDVEPWEYNLTTLVDFESKWSSMVGAGVPIPTPRIDKYERRVGAFEGGGYVKKGVYSPMQDCKMKSNQTNEFCPVCVEAVRKVMNSYINR